MFSRPKFQMSKVKMYLPLVSVIIPTFNSKESIRCLLQSINAQSYSKIEVIIVDDGSNDNTLEIAKVFSVRIFKRKHAERSIQRNFGASKGRGELFMFLDSDMELTTDVIKDCVEVMVQGNFGALVIPEKTVGESLIVKVRKFEREMYMNDLSIEVARVFKRETFFEFGGYDTKLTGPEDYDLPYRISNKYKIGRGKEFLLHHEEKLTIGKLLKKKYYYGKRGADYATKHPELIKTQGNLIFRKAYLRNWKKFIFHPLMGAVFIFIRILENVWAIAGYISQVGVGGFIKSLLTNFYV